MRRYASYPTYSSVHPVGLISRVSGASGIGCRMRRYASYPTYSSVHPVGLISRVSGASGIGCRMRRHPSYPTYSSVHLVGLISRVSDASGIGCRIQSTGVFYFTWLRRPDKSRQRRIRHRLSNTINGRFLFHLAMGKQVVELLFVLVVVDAFVQLVAGLHGVDDAFLRAFLAQDVVDMFSGAVHGAER